MMETLLPCTPGIAGESAVPIREKSRYSKDRLRAAVDEHYELVWRTLRRLGVAEPGVDDAAQQVLVVFARRIDDVRDGSERAFMLSTAIRVASDVRKKQTRFRESSASETLDDRPSSSPAADDLIDRERARELLDRVLAEMPDDLRATFVLFELEEMTMATIAELLGIPAGTVASRLRRAREIFALAAERFSQCTRQS